MPEIPKESSKNGTIH